MNFCLMFSVSKALKATRYPFLGVIVLRSGRMTVVQRIQGPIGWCNVLCWYFHLIILLTLPPFALSDSASPKINEEDDTNNLFLSAVN